jgi:ABC-2 type transport system permease protein
MTATSYARLELLRAFRSTRFFVFSLVFPLVMFFLIAAPRRHDQADGVFLPLYFMVGMVAWGAMAAVTASGARIAGERAVGWNRQLRLTPLRARIYFGAKVATGYALAVLTIAVLFAAGMLLGVRLPLTSWLVMTGLILVGLLPFAALGVVLGHVLTVDSLGPAMGGITAVFALLGGTWGPIAASGAMHDIARVLPSYWLVQAGKSAVSGKGWPLEAWVVIGVWTAVLVRLAATVYRRDTKRV